MGNLKFILFAIIVLVIVGLVGYWAILTIEPGDVHATRQKQKELEQKNQELEQEVTELKDKLAALQPPEPETIPTPDPTTIPTETAVYKYQNLINDLQQLVTDKVVMKEKSRGTRVGTLQTFLNIYNNTTKKVDNDFGKTTKTDVINFQKAVGLTADGQTGPTTYQKMIDWLKKQG